MKQNAVNAQYALLVEDEWSVQEAYTNLLTELGFVVTAAESIEEAHRTINSDPTRFDLAVIDIRLRHEDEVEPRSGDASGIAIARRFKTAMPDAGVLFITSYERYLPDVLDLVMQGCNGIGFMLKGTKKSVTYEAIKHVLEGKIFIKLSMMDAPPPDASIQFLSALHPTVARAVQNVVAKLPLLTDRERQVVEHLTAHRSIIARRLGIEQNTIVKHIERVRVKLGFHEDYEQSQILQPDMIIMLAVLLQSLQPNEQKS